MGSSSVSFAPPAQREREAGMKVLGGAALWRLRRPGRKPPRVPSVRGPQPRMPGLGRVLQWRRQRRQLGTRGAPGHWRLVLISGIAALNFFKVLNKAI